MRAQHRRCAACRGRGFSVAAALLMLCAVATQAVGQDGKAEVHFGFAGWSRPDCWTPVLVEVPQGFAGGNFEGMAFAYPSGDCDADRGRSAAPVVLTAAEGGEAQPGQRFWLYVRPGADLFSGSAYLESRDGRRFGLFANRRIAGGSFGESEVVVLVAGRAVGLEGLLRLRVASAEGETIAPYAGHYATVRCDVNRLPDRDIGYEGIDVLLLVNPEVDRELKQAQLEAIVRWVEGGGRLVVVAGRQDQVPAGSRLAEIMPADMGSLVAIRSAAQLQQFAGQDRPPPKGEITIPLMRPRPGSRVERAVGNVPVAVEGLVGMGSVMLIGLDVQSQAVRDWQAGLPVFVGGLLRLAPERRPAAGRVFCGMQADRYTAPRGGFGSVAFFWAVIILTVGYILLGGPVLHAALKARGRLNLSWPIYFSMGLVVAAVCFGLVSLVRNRDVLTTTLTVVDIPADGRAVIGRSCHNTRFPNSWLYEVRITAPSGYLAMKPVGDGLIDPLWSGDRLFDYAPTLLGIENLPVKSNQFCDFVSRWRGPAGSAAVIAAGVKERGNGFSGTLAASLDIRQAVFISPRFTCELPTELRRGGTAYLDQLSARILTERYLQGLAASVMSGAQQTGFGHGPYGHRDEEERPASVGQVFRDICLGSCYEAYRRKPDPGDAGPYRRELSRTGWARSLDLTHVLDAGCGILIGEAEMEVPDGVLVEGRTSDDTKRLVIFRQVIPMEPLPRAAGGGRADANGAGG